MNREQRKNKIVAIILTIALTISMMDIAFVDVFANGEENLGESQTQEVTESTDDADAPETKDVQESEDVSSGEPAQVVDAAENTSDTPAGELVEAKDGEADIQDAFENASDPVNLEDTTEDVPSIKVIVEGGVNFITATWDEVEDAEYYMVYLDDQVSGEKVIASPDVPRKRMFSVKSGSHSVTVKAFCKRETDSKLTTESEADESGETEEVTDELLAEGTAEDINSVVRPMLGNGDRGVVNVSARGFGYDLRALIGEKHSGYAVAQGAASDGVYGYFLLVKVNADIQCGRIVKIRLSDRKFIKCGPVIDVDHGNGMTYDSKRNLIVINQCAGRRNKIVYVDPNTLAFKSTKKLQYPYKFSGMPSEKSYTGGIAAIAYVEKFDVYLARARGRNTTGKVGDNAVLNDLWVFDAATLNAIGHIHTKICADFPTLYQSMAADERYAYFLLSPGKGQSRNIILALDWNSEKLLPVMNGEKKYVESVWSCNDNSGGKPDAVIRVPIKHEAEGLLLVKDETTGRNHFYVSEFYGRAHYKTVKKTKKVKKKWKKVRKWYNKKTKKWTTKKPKKKYRGKSKKVWKYKYKKKKVKVKVQDYWARSDYVYDLGVF